MPDLRVATIAGASCSQRAGHVPGARCRPRRRRRHLRAGSSRDGSSTSRPIAAFPARRSVWEVLEGSRSTTSVVTDDSGIYVVQVPSRIGTLSASTKRVAAATIRLASDVRATDFSFNTGGCPLRYGIVIDAATRRPIAGALVHWAFVETRSNADGSYRLNLECRPSPGYGFGTTSFFASHPSYTTWSRFDARAETLGRNPGESREDIALTPR